jgi:hypothetical protein
LRTEKSEVDESNEFLGKFFLKSKIINGSRSNGIKFEINLISIMFVLRVIRIIEKIWDISKKTKVKKVTLYSLCATENNIVYLVMNKN